MSLYKCSSLTGQVVGEEEEISCFSCRRRIPAGTIYYCFEAEKHLLCLDFECLPRFAAVHVWMELSEE